MKKNLTLDGGPKLIKLDRSIAKPIQEPVTTAVSIQTGTEEDKRAKSDFGKKKVVESPAIVAPQTYLNNIRSYEPVKDAALLDVDVSPALEMVRAIRDETGQREPLKGKKFAVVLESEFIPTEQKAYAVMIRELGGEVEFASHLWNQPSLTFFSDVQGDWDKPQAKLHLEVSRDIVNDVLPNLSSYSGIIFSANDTMKRLNFTPEIGSAKNDEELQTALDNRPLGKLVDAVMKDEGLVKAFNCHAIWALQHHPEHAKGLTMAFNGVMAGEARLMGINMAPNPEGQDVHRHTHADGNVVSSAAGVEGGTEALIRTLVQTVLKNEPRGEAAA